MSLPDPIEESKTPEQTTAARAELERKSTEELFAATLGGDYDDDAAWEAVTVLRLRGTPDVFDMASRYCKSENPKARARGLSVLAQLGAGRPESERPFMAESVSIAAESVSIAITHVQDSSPEVVSSAAWALSHLGTEAAVGALIDLRKYPDPDVRQAVACCTELTKHAQAVPILTALMEDENDVVRDWATFALAEWQDVEGGVWRYHDSPEIRAGLKGRVEDKYEEARREAIWGLAKRKDTLGLELLLKHLESESWWSGDGEAAQEILSVKAGASIEELRQGLRQLLA